MWCTWLILETGETEAGGSKVPGQPGLLKWDPVSESGWWEWQHRSVVEIFLSKCDQEMRGSRYLFINFTYISECFKIRHLPNVEVQGSVRAVFCFHRCQNSLLQYPFVNSTTNEPFKRMPYSLWYSWFRKEKAKVHGRPGIAQQVVFLPSLLIPGCPGLLNPTFSLL